MLKNKSIWTKSTKFRFKDLVSCSVIIYIQLNSKYLSRSFDYPPPPPHTSTTVIVIINDFIDPIILLLLLSLLLLLLSLNIIIIIINTIIIVIIITIIMIITIIIVQHRPLFRHTPCRLQLGISWGLWFWLLGIYNQHTSAKLKDMITQ